MMVNRQGVTIPQRFSDWLAVVVGVCAILGPPISFFLAVSVANARNEQRLTSLEQNDASTRAVLAQVRDDVAYIRGRMEGRP